MNRSLAFLLSFIFILSACGTAAPQVVNVYAASFMQAQLDDLYACSPAIAIRLSEPQSADITLRLGEPANLTAPAFQVGTEEILVIVHPGAGVSSLTREQVRQVFLGQITNWREAGGNDLPVQVWTFAQDSDIQQIFSRAVMNGQPVTSLARLAVSVEAMSNSVETAPGSVGVVTRRWKPGNTPEVLSIATAPVLAIVRSQPQGAVKELIACLQSN